MNETIRDMWHDALESGRYKQGKHNLRSIKDSGDEYCCLGVLCELAAAAGVIPQPTVERNGGVVHRYMYGEAVDPGLSALPASVMRWADIGDSLGDEVQIDGATLRLAFHNDLGVTFPEIAKAIKEQL